MNHFTITFEELSKIIGLARYAIFKTEYPKEHEDMMYNTLLDIEEFIYMCPDQFFTINRTEE